MRLKGKAGGKAKAKGLWLRILSLIQGSTSVSGVRVRVVVRVVGFAALSAAALASSSAALSAASVASAFGEGSE